ncbi:MAG: hypothetical protein SFX73_31560 [Kofleriaceae bacterium]|nr:hypothetical protein [Kofleriaceae bacterium]
MRRAAFVMLAVLGSCDGAGLDTDEAKLGSLAFEVPATWERTNHEPSGARSAMWTPLADENARKESVTVIRTVAYVDPERLANGGLGQLLAGAQGSLLGARISPVTPFQTRRGFTGAKIEVTFQAGAGASRYRRIHAVLLEPGTGGLVHVMYTAANPDNKLTAFYTVLESIHHEGA